jgi:hypothetical protein
LQDEEALRGVVATDIPREVIARFSGTLILKEPERQPEIIFDRGWRYRDNGDAGARQGSYSLDFPDEFLHAADRLWPQRDGP